MSGGPIGVFDSGLGGLTAVRELQAILPGEDIVYFGDTGRVPYGSRGRETIIAYAKQDIALLLSKDVKMVLAACGTVSSTLPKSESDTLSVPYIGVVLPTAAAAAKATKNGRVGIIGTEATIASGSYRAALAQISGDVVTTAASCPLFVPLVENGHFAPDDEMARIATEKYLKPIKEAGVDTLILGCTHYPLMADVISQYMGSEVQLINSGRQAALATKQALVDAGLVSGNAGGGQTTFFVSDEPARFSHLANIFLGTPLARAERVNIEEYSL